MPPKKARPKSPPPYRSRWQKEKQRQRWILSLGTGAIALVLAIVGGAFFYYNVSPRWEPVLKVNQSVFTATDLAQRLRLLGAGRNPQQDLSPLVGAVLDQIQQDELLRQKAPGLGLSVSTQEIDEELRQAFVPPGQEGDFAQLYARRLKETGLTDAQFRRLVEPGLLARKAQEHFLAQLPAEAEQVHLLGILLREEAKAQEARQRLEQGEDFSALAKELSQDPASKEKGGDMGWLPLGVRPELEEAAFSLAPGEVSQPLSTPQGFYLLRVTEKEVRPLEEEHRQQLKLREYERWLKEQEASSKIERSMEPRLVRWALSQARRG